MGRVRGRRPERWCAGIAEGWGKFGVTDPCVGVLSPRVPLSLVGVDLSFVRYPVLSFSQPEGLSFVACLDRSGSSDAFSELANGYNRVESGSVIRDGVGIALL